MTKTTKVIGGIIGGLILNLIASLIFEKWKDLWLNLFNFIGQGVSWFYNSILLYNIPVWLVMLIVIAVVLFMIWLVKWAFKKPLAAEMPFANYLHDTFGKDHTLWGWGYKDGHIDALAPICPNCQSITKVQYVHSTSFRTLSECSRCRLEGRVFSIIVYQNTEDVSNEIIRRIDTDEYKKATG